LQTKTAYSNSARRYRLAGLWGNEVASWRGWCAHTVQYQ